MPLQNRVTPDMQVLVQSWRGNFMGNRGGRIHDPQTKTLLTRKWASKRWIICTTEFKGRKRELMGDSYTELFFLDEVSALTAGHRPCFECRRKQAKLFSNAWISCFGQPQASLADTMDKTLHEERITQPRILSLKEIKELPEGAIIEVAESFFAKKGNNYLLWSGDGYKASDLPDGEIKLLTPNSILEVLNHGYLPEWHESAL